MLKLFYLIILFIWSFDENVGQSFNKQNGMMSLSDREIQERLDYGRRASLANEMRREKGIIIANSIPIDYRSWSRQKSLVIQPRVLEASDANSGTFKFYAQIIDYERKNICGGTVIGSKEVLTAAHCVYDWVDLPPDDKRFQIFTASIDSQRGDYTTWKKIIVHKRYMELMKSDPENPGKRREYDIAIIALKDSVSKSSIISVASKEGEIGTKGDFAGFGVSAYLSEGDSIPVFPRVMQVARKLQILDESIDERDSSFFTKNVGGEGDSGGPYIWNENGKQVLGGLYVGETVMDSGSVRAEFLQVKNYKDWINGRIAELNRDEL